MDLKIKQGSKYAKDAGKPKKIAGPGGFFWITSGGLTAQDKIGTHEQLSQTQTVMDHPGKYT